MHGLHRKVVSALFGAVVLGGAAGWLLHSLPHPGARATVGVATFVLFWPLASIATFRIVHPIVRLARVAGALREGDLPRRTEIDAGDDEVGEVAGALKVMAERVAGQLNDQRALMAAVSHELRSPLGRLRILVELAREERAPPDVHDRIQGEIDGMDTLVGDLLAASRIDFEAVQPVEVRPSAIAQRALDAAGMPSSLLRLDHDAPIRVDATLLVRAVSGLLVNAARHGGGPVALRVFEIDDQVRFEVTDAGPGFGEGQAEQVFEPFWRAPGRPPGGVGLGLALVRRIAQAHEGRAGAANRAAGGARVWLEVPG